MKMSSSKNVIAANNNFHLSSSSLDFLKLFCSAFAVSVVLTAVTGQVWNSLHWKFVEQILMSEFISATPHIQTIPESLLIMLLYASVASSFAIAVDCVKTSSQYERKRFVTFTAQVMILAFISLVAIVKFKSPAYLRM